nr:MAG TPA: hypothetical protein [Caudoviricetes sp.]
MLIALKPHGEPFPIGVVFPIFLFPEKGEHHERHEP